MDISIFLLLLFRRHRPDPKTGENKRKKELWKKVIKTKERKRKISEIKQKIQNNLNVHRLVTEKKKMLAKKNVQGLFGQLTIVSFSP